MNKETQRIKYVITDWVSASLMWFVFNVVRFHEIAHHYGFSNLSSYIFYHRLVEGQIIIPILWIVLSYYSGYYNQVWGKSRLDEFLTSFFISVLGTLVIFFGVVLNDLPPVTHIYYRLFSALLFLSFVFTYFPRFIITQVASVKIRKRKWMVQTLVIGKGEQANLVTRLLEKPVDSVAYNIAGYVNSDQIYDLSLIIEEKQISQLIVAVDEKGEGKLLKILYSLYQYNLPIKIPLTNHKMLTGNIRTKSITAVPLFDLSSCNLSDSSKNIKHTADILVSLLVLTLLSPLYAFLALKVKLDSKGSILFKQERIGYMGKPFLIYKFRTMYEDAELEGPLLSFENDDRVTNFGRFLRKYRLDELPQFWNVLKGDMSLVGPRPERKFYIDQIVKEAPWFYLLHNIKPGITSWGMVKYGYASTVQEMIERLKYDIIYYENMSLVVDIKILIYTIRTVLTGKGV